jgi:hypothetical protein
MDLKRAWRNGFLASLIFAIPLSDLYYNQHTNLIIDNSSQKTPVQHAKNCVTDCAGFENGSGRYGNIASKTSPGKSDIDGSGLAIPGDSLTRMLLESGDSDFGDIREAALQFDPQDIFQSELTGEFDPDSAGNAQQIIDTDIGSVASRSYGFGDSRAYAPGFSGPFMPAVFAPGGETGSAGLQNAIGDDTPSDNTNAEIDNESLHSVPEPTPLVLMTIGTISVAARLYRKSKSSTIHS